MIEIIKLITKEKRKFIDNIYSGKIVVITIQDDASDRERYSNQMGCSGSVSFEY